MRQEYIFWHEGKRYQGYLILSDEDTPETHFKIEEIVSNKIILLPKINTKMEEVQ